MRKVYRQNFCNESSVVSSSDLSNEANQSRLIRRSQRWEQRRRRNSCHPFKLAALLLLVVAIQSSSYHPTVATTDEGNNAENESLVVEEEEYIKSHSSDPIEDSMYDPLSADPSCSATGEDDCNAPPKSTVFEEEIEKLDPTCFKGAGDNDPISDEKEQQCAASGGKTKSKGDKHWGDNPKTLSMRDHLREQSKNFRTDKRPPIFMLPGLASTRLVAWKHKKCLGALSSDVKVQDNVWLNINLILRVGTSIDIDCFKECLSLGVNQSDTDDWETGCKLRPDEGLDSIASLAPGGMGADLLVGGVNTVYAWLIQWLADNLGYDVTNMIAFPYDWRLTPSVMESRDGFLSLMRKRIEGAVATSKQPGIMVAHSM